MVDRFKIRQITFLGRVYFCMRKTRICKRETSKISGGETLLSAPIASPRPLCMMRLHSSFLMSADISQILNLLHTLLHR